MSVNDPGQNRQLEKLVSILGVHRPTGEQAAVITHPLSVPGANGPVAAPLLVVAGAGSGKTETMSLRAVYLVATQGIDDGSILGLTFTKKAAAELEDRLTSRLAQHSQSQDATKKQRGFAEFSSAAVATTYNAFALRIVQEFGPMIGLSGDFSHLDEAAKWQLMYGVVETWIEPLEGDFSINSVVDNALSLRESITNQGMSSEQVRHGLDRLEKKFELAESERKGKLPAFLKEGRSANVLRRQLLDIVDEFERQKTIVGRMDYADQVIAATRIIESVPSVRTELRSRHQVVFLDEFQDTSVAQMRFLAALFSDHPVTAVGDPNQAIYGWRGASAGSLEDFHSLFTTNQSSPRTILNLSTAWRNAKTILDVANQVSSPLQIRTWVQSQGDNTGLPNLKLNAQPNATPGIVESIYRQTAEEQVEEIVRFVQTTHAAEAAAGNQHPTIAVLCRRRKLINQTIDALREAGFAAETNGSDGLLFHPAVLDLRAALEVAADIGRSSQLLRLLANLDLGSADLWALGNWATRIARQNATEYHPLALLLEAVDATVDAKADVDQSGLSQTAIDRLAVLGKRLRKIRRASDRSLVEQVEFARRILHLDEEALSTGQAQDVTEVLDSFTGAASTYQGATAFPTMTGFLEWLTAAEKKERGLSLPSVPSNPNAVQVMTIHASKGLEWDAVAVIDMEMGAFPSYPGKAIVSEEDSEGNVIATPPALPPGQGGWWKKPGELPYQLRRDHAHLPDPYIWDPEQKAGEIFSIFRGDVGAYLLAEERRLAYVAFTRPRRRLTLIGSWMTGGKTARYPSVFMTELEELPQVEPYKDACPNAAEIANLLQSDLGSPFPKRPGETRKRVTLSAARVLEELRGFHSDSSPKPTLEETLATVTDQGLATKARVLIGEHKETQLRRHRSETERAKEDVLLAGQPWEFRATDIIGKTETEDLWVELRRPVPTEPQPASSLGTAFHQWVETELRRVSAAEANADAPINSAAADLPMAPTDEPQVHLDDNSLRELKILQDQLRTISWLSKHEIVAIEVPFAVEMWGLLVRGRIDAVFRDRSTGAYILVDWKTSKLPDWGKGNARIPEYLSQLSIYEYAWKLRLDDPTIAIDSRLIFVHADGIREVDLEELTQQYVQSFGKKWSLQNSIEKLRVRLELGKPENNRPHSGSL